MHPAMNRCLISLPLRVHGIRSCLKIGQTHRRFATDKERKFPEEIPSFSSADSLNRIYPNSRLDMTVVPDPPVASDPNTFTGYIPMSQLKIRYARSGGPGGQHLHKTNTKVAVSVHLESAEWIPQSTRTELMRIVSHIPVMFFLLFLSSFSTRTASIRTASGL